MPGEISVPHIRVVPDDVDLVAPTTPVLDDNGGVDVVLTVLSVFPRSRIIGTRLKPRGEEKS